MGSWLYLFRQLISWFLVRTGEHTLMTCARSTLQFPNTRVAVSHWEFLQPRNNALHSSDHWNILPTTGTFFRAMLHSSKHWNILLFFQELEHSSILPSTGTFFHFSKHWNILPCTGTFFQTMLHSSKHWNILPFFQALEHSSKQCYILPSTGTVFQAMDTKKR